MARRTRPRLLLALASSGAVFAALALPVAPASATLPPSQLQTFGSVSFSNGSSGTRACSEVGTEPSDSVDIVNGSASDSLSMDTTVTNTDPVSPDPNDHSHVTGHIAAASTVKTQQGAMTSYRMTGTGQVSVSRFEGGLSNCNVHANMTAETVVSFTETKPGWVYLTRTQQKNLVTEMGIVRSDNSLAYIEIYGGPQAGHAQRVFLRPGSYAALAALIVSDGGTLALKAPPSATLAGTFHAAGSALGRAKGAAATYVAFPASVSCAHHTATLRWKAGAGGVAGGTFAVNGVTRAADGHPVAGHAIVLRHLSSTADLHITAGLALKGGGHATATRTYVPCSG